MAFSLVLVLGECKALWGELERVSESSLLHWSLNPRSRSTGNWHTHAHLEGCRDATWRNSISIPCRSTCTRTWILDKACLNTGTGRPSCQTQGMLRASRNPIWLDFMYFAEDNRALLLHCASLWMHAFNVDLVTTFTFRRVEYFLEVEVDRVRAWKETRSDRTSCSFCWPEISGPCIGMRVRRGSVALYCASVCALCAARCGACDRRGLARKKYRAGEKAPAQR